MNLVSQQIPARFELTINQADFPAEFDLDHRLGRILIVDDSAVTRKVFKRCLALRYDCSEASSAIQALAELRTNRYDLVITDVMMPGLSGVELLRRVIESYPETSVLVVS